MNVYDMYSTVQPPSHVAVVVPAQDVLATAKARLHKSSSVVVRSIACEFDRGVLRLRGRVPTYYCKQLAQETVAHLPGVVQVDNAIEVVASP